MMKRTIKTFGRRAKITVSFCGGSSESFSVPLCLVGNIAPVVAAQYRGGMVTVETKAETVHSSQDCRTFADRLRGFIRDVSKTFGRSYTTGGCDICGHVPTNDAHRVNYRGAAVS